MKILKISASGLPLFEKKCEIDFTAQQRVSADNANNLYCLFLSNSRKCHLNNVISFIGVNASGKTTVLKLITFVMHMLNNRSINNIDSNSVLNELSEDKCAVFDVCFFDDNNGISLLHTAICKNNDRFIISDEMLYSKKGSTVKNKADIFNFDNVKPSMVRNNDNDFLLDDISIIVAFNKRTQKHISLYDMTQYTSENKLNLSDDYPPELIAFFDKNIEYLRIQKNRKDSNIHLKFHNSSEITLNKLSDINMYLSSGTIKGINVFLYAIKTFKNGGYLIVDELENHFNQEIVSTLIRLYMDKKVNPNGATLIFSTHYSEILDIFERNDSIYIIRNNKGEITTDNISTLINRNDMKKSEIYQSGFLEGTTPIYDSYIDLKKSIIKSHREIIR